MATITEIWQVSGTWTAPVGVTSVDVECWGGGGGGGFADSDNDDMGAGGGGGAYSRKNGISVTPGNPYTVTVGGGGSGGTSGGHTGQTGGDSTFNSTSCVAKGGIGGGSNPTSATGGNGGAAGSGTGDTKYSGGRGADRSSSAGGGGGAGAGTANDGADGSGGTGGAGANEGGTGGAGPSSSANGGGGQIRGGGGGGSYSTSGLGFNGGAGQRGEVRITYDSGSFNYEATTAYSTPLTIETQEGFPVSPSVKKIDANHFLVFWSGSSNDGFVQVIQVNLSTWEVTTSAARLEFDTQDNSENSCVKIDTNHFLNFWKGPSGDGFVQVFTVNTTTWAVTTAAASLEFDTQDANFMAAFEIDANHFICFWAGSSADGFVQVFTVNTTTWAVTTAAASLEFDTQNGEENACYQIDSNHFINFWEGASSDGFAQTFEVNTTTWAVTTVSTQFEFDTQNGRWFSTEKIDTNHFITFYRGSAGTIGYMQVFEVNTTTWAITTTSARTVFDDPGASNIGYVSVTKIDDNHFIAEFYGNDGGAYYATYEVNTTTWAITTIGGGGKLKYDDVGASHVKVKQIDTSHYLTVKQASDLIADVYVVDVPTTGTEYDEEYSETVTMVDTIAKAPSRTLIDVATVVDTVTKSTSRTLVDVATLVDTVLKMPSRTLSDEVTVVDVISKQGQKMLVEVVTVVDTIVRQLQRTIVDVVTLVDEFTGAKIISATLTDIVTIVDNVYKQAQKVLTDAVVAVDTVIRQTSRTLTDVVVLVDTVTGVKLAVKELLESVVVVDTILKQGMKMLTEVITPVDTLVRQVSRTLTDIVTPVDTVLKQASRTFTDGVTAVDTITRSISRTLVDVVTPVDTVVKQATRTLTEAVVVVDTMLRQMARTLTDPVVLVDTVTKSFSRTMAEVVTVVDTVLKQASKTFADAITVVDTLATARTYGRILTETITIVDELITFIATTARKGVTILLTVADTAVASLGSGYSLLRTVKPNANVLKSKQADLSNLPTKDNDQTIL